jgi:hypothetical protein
MQRVSMLPRLFRPIIIAIEELANKITAGLFPNRDNAVFL